MPPTSLPPHPIHPCSAPVSTPIILHAVIHCCFKRGLASFETIRGFLDELRTAAPVTAGDLRRFLGQVKGGNRGLADALLALQPRPGHERCGPYTRWFRLADGTQGRTWLASGQEERPASGRTTSAIEPILVIKQLHPDLVGTPEAKMRFERERLALAAIHHQHVVSSIGHGIDHAGDPYLVMAYIDGGDLKTLFSRAGRMPAADALLMALQAAQGLRAVHRQGLVHRDIKPQNILVTRKGRVKIADFGASRPHDQGPSSHSLVAGPIVNPLYVAPEQTDPNTRLDGRADIYSLGAILYHGLTGEPPFQARQLFDLQRAHHEAPIPDPRRLVPDLPAELTYLIQCCLAKDRAKRLDAEGLEERIGDLMVELKVERHTALAQETIIRSVPEVSGLQALAEGAADGSRPVAPGIAAAIATVTTPPRVEATALPQTPLDQGHDGDWLVLTGPGGRCLHLLARTTAILGRLPEAPCDLTIRLFPEDERKNAHIGRQHLRLTAGTGGLEIADLAAANGTEVDGQRLGRNQVRPLTSRCVLTLGRVLDLQIALPAPRSPRLTQIPGWPPGQTGARCGLETTQVADAVVITRPGNRPELAYALVLRCVTLGGPGSDLPIPGAEERWEIGRYAGRWIRRVSGSPWQPLALGQTLDLGPGLALTTQTGTYAAF